MTRERGDEADADGVALGLAVAVLILGTAAADCTGIISTAIVFIVSQTGHAQPRKVHGVIAKTDRLSGLVPHLA